MPERIIHAASHAFSTVSDKTIAVGITGTTGTAVMSQVVPEQALTANDLLTYTSIAGGMLTCIYVILKIYGQYKENQITDRRLDRRKDDPKD